MRVADVMRSEIPAIPVDAFMRDAILAMRRGRLRHLLAMDGENVVGVLSERDAGWGDDHVRDAMSTPVISVRPDASLQEAAALMAEHDVGCLPVTSNGHPVGVLVARDLLQALARVVA